MAKRPDLPDSLALGELSPLRGTLPADASVRKEPGPASDGAPINAKTILARHPTLRDWQVVMGQLRDALRKIAQSELVRSDPLAQRIIHGMVGRPIKDVKAQMDRLEKRVRELLAERHERAAKAQAAKERADQEAAAEAVMAAEIEERGKRRVLQAVNATAAPHREEAGGERRMLLRL